MNKYLNIFEQIIADYGVEEDEDVKDLHSFLAAMTSTTSNKPAFTEIGLDILAYLQQGHEKNNKAKDIAEGMNLPSKKISGAMRKLVTDGYVEKFGQNPVIYSLTEQGKNFDITSYKETLNNEEDIH
jgi:predicted transcriptional regulator